MDQELMSNEENYCFDIAGYLHVPGVLNRGEVVQLNQTIDKAGQLSGMLGWEGELKEPFRESTHPSAPRVVSQSNCRNRLPPGPRA